MKAAAKLGIGMAMLLGASLQAGGRDKQAPPTVAPPVTASSPSPSAPVSENAQPTAPLAPGAYATDHGWGRLSIERDAANRLAFSLETQNSGSGCSFSGKIAGTQASLYDGTVASACTLDLAANPGGIEIGSKTEAACRAYCGTNGSYAGDYRKLSDACAPTAVQRARDAFKALYDRRAYADAEATLAPVHRECLSSLGLIDEAGVRNDYALTQHELGNDAACLAALDKYAADLDKSDDAITDGMAPAIAEDYLGIIAAARTNARLCGHAGKRPPSATMTS